MANKEVKIISIEELQKLKKTKEEIDVLLNEGQIKAVILYKYLEILVLSKEFFTKNIKELEDANIEQISFHQRKSQLTSIESFLNGFISIDEEEIIELMNLVKQSTEMIDEIN